MNKTIDINKKYYLEEITDKKLIPGVDTYGILYNLVTHLERQNERELNKITTNGALKGEHDGNPWNKRAGKIYVKGIEIVKFLKLNNLV